MVPVYVCVERGICSSACDGKRTHNDRVCVYARVFVCACVQLRNSSAAFSILRARTCCFHAAVKLFEWLHPLNTLIVLDYTHINGTLVLKLHC